jgi:hypothetical protein
MENGKYPRRERPGQSHRRGSQLAGRCGRAKGMKGERSFGELSVGRTENIRPLTVARNAKSPLKSEDVLGRNCFPLRHGLRCDADGARNCACTIGGFLDRHQTADIEVMLHAVI